MRILINDTNILIDLIYLDLLDIFFNSQNIKLKTTDFVIHELNKEQQIKIQRYSDNGSLEVIKSSYQDLTIISQISSQTTGLSIPDCSVLHHAKAIKGILLTGDRKLRNVSISHGIEVKGIIYIFDYLLLNTLITFELAIEKINQLYEFNNRLPYQEKEKRIRSWTNNQHCNE